MKPQLELIDRDINSSLRAFRYAFPNFESPYHYHPEYELTLILKSSGIRYVGSSIQHFSVGDLVLVGPNVAHCWKNDKGYHDGAASLCIQWNDIISPVGHLTEFEGVHQLLQQSAQGIKFIDHPSLAQVKGAMASLVDLPPLLRLLTLWEILGTLAKHPAQELLCHHQPLKKGTLPADRRVVDTLNHLENHYMDKITLEDMASLACLSKVAFCKFFKKHFNRSFVTYLNEFRVKKACGLLQATNLKTMDVAFQSGFHNMAQFHRQFIRVTGRTPMAYRKEFMAI